MTKTLKLFRTILTGVGYLEGNWKVCRDRAKKINIIEPVLEGVMQLFFQSIILYIVYGPGTSKVQSILVLFKMSILSSWNMQLLYTWCKPVLDNKVLVSCSDYILFWYCFVQSVCKLCTGAQWQTFVRKMVQRSGIWQIKPNSVLKIWISNVLNDRHWKFSIFSQCYQLKLVLCTY